MCNICDGKNINRLRKITLCNNVMELPIEMNYIEELYCNSNNNITTIPREYSKLKVLECSNTKITRIPPEFLRLNTLWCGNCNIELLPRELVRLQVIFCNGTNITEIPDTYINLKTLFCINTKIKINIRNFPNIKYIDNGS